MGSTGRFAAGAAGVLLLVGSLAGCTSSSKPAAGPTAAVERATISNGVSSTGSLSATTSQELGFVKGGQLTKVKVKVGDHVDKGDLLATIDDYALKRVVDQQEANLAQQEAILGRVGTNPGVSGASATLNQARQIVAAIRKQVKATENADDTAIHRAKKQLDFDEDARDDADDAVDDAKDACDADPTACAAVFTVESGYSAAKLRVETDKTALATAEEKKKVDCAAGKVQIETAEQSVVTAQNALNSTSSDRPFNIGQQRALVDNAKALVRNAKNDVRDATLEAPFSGVVTAVNGRVGEYLTASNGTTALAPGSDASIPGADSASSSAAAGGTASPSRPGGSQFIVLSGLKKLAVVLPFEESDAAQIKAGQPIDVTFDAVPDLTERGIVTSVAPSGTAISGVINYYVTAELKHTDKRLRAGQTAEGTVVTSEAKDVLSVPNAAVHHQGDADTVIVVDPGNRQRTVTFEAGIVGPDRTEVRSGLSEGDQILLPAGTN